MFTMQHTAPDVDNPQVGERLFWLLELMSRHATEKSEHHDSARLAAAIVAHLKALSDDLPAGSREADTVQHWLELWEPIMERQVGLQRRPGRGLTASLQQLVARARYA